MAVSHAKSVCMQYFPDPKPSRVGKVASGASRIGQARYEKERGERLKSRINESTRAPLVRSPFPDGAMLLS